MEEFQIGQIMLLMFFIPTLVLQVLISFSIRVPLSVFKFISSLELVPCSQSAVQYILS